MRGRRKPAEPAAGAGALRLALPLLLGGPLQNLGPEAQRHFHLLFLRLLQKRIYLRKLLIVGACRRVGVEMLLQRLPQGGCQRVFRVF